jgi:altronate hydrolase
MKRPWIRLHEADHVVIALRDALLDEIIRLASGESQTKSELNGFREFAIFKDGVTL